MNGQTICEVMLYSYKDLEEKCNGIEYKIRKQCEKSMHTSIYDTFDRVVLLINEKIAYCNVKVIIDEAVAKIGDGKAIKEHYCLGRDLKRIADEHSLKVPQVVELIEKQKHEVIMAILRAYSPRRLFDIISDSRWLVNQCIAKEREWEQLKNKTLTT